MAGLVGGGHHAEAQLFIAGGGEHRALDGGGGDGGGQEEALIQLGQQTQIGADLPTQAGGGQAAGTAVDEVGPAADVAAGGGQTAAGVLDKATHDHVRAYVGRLPQLGELAVAVVHHADDVRLALLAEGDELADLLHGEAGAGGVALGALDGDQLGLLVDGGADTVVVKGTAGQQIHLPVGDAVLPEGAGGGADADDLLQRVVGAAHGTEQLIAGQQVGAQRQCQRVGAAGDLGTHQRRLGAEAVGVDPLQIVAALVVVAVAGGEIEVIGGQPVFLHGGDDLHLVGLGNGVDLGEALRQTGENLLAEGEHGIADAEGFVLFGHDLYLTLEILRRSGA